MHWMYMNDGGWIMMIVWWILLVIAVVFLIKWMNDNSGGSKGETESSLELLKRRFANSEISREEFEERKKVLEQN